jgi:hypothetical protein
MLCFRSEVCPFILMDFLQNNHGVAFQSHSLCSESFYRKEIEADIRTQATEERLKMLQLLKRFEEQNDEDDLGSSSEEEGETEQDTHLARRFDGINLGKLVALP